MDTDSSVIFLLLVVAGFMATSAVASEEVAPREEPIFVSLARDPYVKRYGQPPGGGWIPMPGTKTEMRITGFIRLDLIHDFQNPGFPFGWFVPAQIPVPTQSTPNTAFDPRSSRFDFETRTNVAEEGSVRTLLDMDFYGNLGSPPSNTNPQPWMRQAYVAWFGSNGRVSFLAGQAWTTFMDLSVWPEIFDLQGPNSMSGIRQGLLRASYLLSPGKKSVVLDIALEQPDTLVLNGNGLRDLPDLATRLTWKPAWGHLQAMALVRELVGESTSGTGRSTAFGYGMSFSGSWMVPRRNKPRDRPDEADQGQDSLQFQIQGGRGTSRYVNDLGTSVNPYDAAYNLGNQSLEAVPQLGGFLAYHHWWNDRLRSQFVCGYEKADNLAIETGDAFNQSLYALVNLGYRLFSRMDIGVEYTWGERRNKDGATGHDNRVLFGINFGF